jgi:hypothetical protein
MEDMFVEDINRVENFAVWKVDATNREHGEHVEHGDHGENAEYVNARRYYGDEPFDGIEFHLLVSPANLRADLGKRFPAELAWLITCYASEKRVARALISNTPLCCERFGILLQRVPVSPLLSPAAAIQPLARQPFSLRGSMNLTLPTPAICPPARSALPNTGQSCPVSIPVDPLRLHGQAMVDDHRIPRPINTDFYIPMPMRSGEVATHPEVDLARRYETVRFESATLTQECETNYGESRESHPGGWRSLERRSNCMPESDLARLIGARVSHIRWGKELHPVGGCAATIELRILSPRDSFSVVTPEHAIYNAHLSGPRRPALRLVASRRHRINLPQRWRVVLWMDNYLYPHDILLDRANGRSPDRQILPSPLM